jgi:hypothetical protein
VSRTDVMLAYVPKFIQAARSYKAVMDAEGPEFDLVRTNIADILSQFYVETATEWGLDLWEQMLGLKSYAGKPLDQRRSRIISKLRGMGTVTVSLIKNVAESYTYGTVEVTERPELYSFTVTFSDKHGIPPNYTDLQAAIEEIKPAHLAVNYVLRYLIWDELDAAALTWEALDAKALTWDEFEMGGWLDA